MGDTLPEIINTSASRLHERIRPRLAIEADFERMGHTYRHSRLHKIYDHGLQRPGITLAMRLLGLWGRGKRNALSTIVRTERLEFNDLPRAFDGFRIMHLSDFHIDGMDGLAEMLAEKLAGIPCDLCVLTGDYRFEDRGHFEQVQPRMRKIVESIQSKFGIYGILGNHDPGQVALDLQEMGVNMLVNDSAPVSRSGESIYLAGVDDNFDYGTDDLDLALREVPADAFTILLAHAPELYEAAEARGIRLNLSGHTHAGQLRVPVIGAVRQNARCPREYTWGAWRYGNLQGFTTCGVGCSALPIRYNCPPEIVILELARGR